MVETLKLRSIFVDIRQKIVFWSFGVYKKVYIGVSKKHNQINDITKV